MVTGIVIPHEARRDVFAHEFVHLSEYQTVVGGYIEAITIERPPLTVLTNEEGKIRQLPINHRATSLWWLHMPAARGHDVIVGDVAVVATGTARPPGSLSADLLGTLTERKPMRIEVRTVVAPSLWVRRDEEKLDDYFQAALAAVAMVRSEPLALDVRVLPVD